MLVFLLAVVLVYLVLAGRQYRKLVAGPLAVILVVPMCLLCSIAGVRDGEHGHQYLHSGRLHRAGGPCLQERDLDRGVRESPARGRRAAPGGHARGVRALLPSTDHDDFVRVHSRRGPLDALSGCRARDEAHAPAPPSSRGCSASPSSASSSRRSFTTSSSGGATGARGCGSLLGRPRSNHLATPRAAESHVPFDPGAGMINASEDWVPAEPVRIGRRRRRAVMRRVVGLAVLKRAALDVTRASGARQFMMGYSLTERLTAPRIPTALGCRTAGFRWATATRRCIGRR